MGQDARASDFSLKILAHRLCRALSSIGKGEVNQSSLPPKKRQRYMPSQLLDAYTAAPAPAADCSAHAPDLGNWAKSQQSPKSVKTMSPSARGDNPRLPPFQPGKERLCETDYRSSNGTAGHSAPRRSYAPSPTLMQDGASGGWQPRTMTLPTYHPAAATPYTPYDASTPRRPSQQRFAAPRLMAEPEDLAKTPPASTPRQAVGTQSYNWSNTPRVQPADAATPRQLPFEALRDITGIDRPTHAMHMDPLSQLDSYRRRIVLQPSPASARSHPGLYQPSTPNGDTNTLCAPSPLRTPAVIPHGVDINDIKDKVSCIIDLTTGQEELEGNIFSTPKYGSSCKWKGSEQFHGGPNSTPETQQAYRTKLMEKKKRMAALKHREALAEAERARFTEFDEENRVSCDRNIEEHEAKLKRQNEITLRQFEQLQIRYRESTEDDEAKDNALRPLSYEDALIVDAALGKGNPTDVLASSNFTNIDIQRSDINCLAGLNWLNDEVINFYMGMLQERELRLSPGKPRVHFFNTFFYNALSKDEGKYNYKKVRRWTTEKRLKGYCILDCQKVVVPIHQGYHWVLGVINLDEQTLEFYDSMGGSDRGALEDLARYIADEYQDKRSQDVDVSGWRYVNHDKIPLQQNCCDCGVFMVAFAEFVSRGAKLTFSQANMPLIRHRMVAQIMHGAVDR
mmetsp:Transcript_3229/g.6327  ORF Transcript_3229/g.6327 Transcript_3229/m.6327 type:complete len:680 (-) Transcript_3229:379-2418(-)